MKKILVIAGPTAVGKTKFAIEAAKAVDGEIVSCDSMQLYKYPISKAMFVVSVLTGANIDPGI